MSRHPNQTPGSRVKRSSTARTMFVPMYPYVGPAKVIVGVYDTTTNTRLKLGNTDRSDRSYQIAEFELLPQTENVYLIYKDGWHPAEVAPDNPGVEWKWTRKEATIAFRNPKRDSTFIVQLDNPAQSTTAASEVELRLGNDSLGTVPVGTGDAPVRKFALSAAQLGSGDMVEIKLVANRTFVPALDPAAKSSDTRELGVRVFHAFIQPQIATAGVRAGVATPGLRGGLMTQVRARRLVFSLLTAAIVMASVSQINAEMIVFANGRTISVKDYRIAGDTITVTFRNGGEATFRQALVARITPDEVAALGTDCCSARRGARAFPRTAASHATRGAAFRGAHPERFAQTRDRSSAGPCRDRSRIELSGRCAVAGGSAWFDAGHACHGS